MEKMEKVSLNSEFTRVLQPSGLEELVRGYAYVPVVFVWGLGACSFAY
jgi:hypothetical protein